MPIHTPEFIGMLVMVTVLIQCECVCAIDTECGQCVICYDLCTVLNMLISTLKGTSSLIRGMYLLSVCIVCTCD